MLDFLAKQGLSVSIVMGTLLVPLTALAAIWLSDPGRAAEETFTPTTATPTTTPTTSPITAATTDITADLQTACGAEGMELVSLEESATITEVQQAALDALRGVCEQQGIPLPPRPSVGTVVQTVVEPPATTTGTVDSTPTTLPHEPEPQFGHGEYEMEGEYDDGAYEVKYEYEVGDGEYEYEYEYEVDD